MWAADQEDRPPRPDSFSHCGKARIPALMGQASGGSVLGINTPPVQWCLLLGLAHPAHLNVPVPKSPRQLLRSLC